MKVYVVVHIVAGVSENVKVFTDYDVALAYQGDILEGFTQGRETPSIEEYNEGDNELLMCQRNLDVASSHIDPSVAMQFIREYFKRYDMEFPALSGHDITVLPDALMKDVLEDAVTMMVMKSNIEGIFGNYACVPCPACEE